MKVSLVNPICTKKLEKVAFCRIWKSSFRLIGWGTITKGQKLEMSTN